MDIEGQKKKFLLNVFFSDSVLSAFQRNRVYEVLPEKSTKKDKKVREKRKSDFKKYLQEFLAGLKDKKKLSQEELVTCMDDFKKKADKREEDGGFSYILLNKENEKRIAFGTVQKLANLYLKYLWCAGLIKFTPPHCPLDRGVLKTVGLEGKSWTKMNKKGYRQAIEAIEQYKKDKSITESIAEWELKNWPF